MLSGAGVWLPLFLGSKADLLRFGRFVRFHKLINRREDGCDLGVVLLMLLLSLFELVGEIFVSGQYIWSCTNTRMMALLTWLARSLLSIILYQRIR